MIHHFSDTQIKELRKITGVQGGSMQTVLSTLGKLIATKQLTVIKQENYVLPHIVNVVKD